MWMDGTRFRHTFIQFQLNVCVYAFFIIFFFYFNMVIGNLCVYTPENVDNKL